MRRLTPLLLFALPALVPGLVMADICEDLVRHSPPGTTISSTRENSAGNYSLSPGTAAVDLPAHCRLEAVLTPSADSHIEMELWLPADWNGKFLAVGNGGWAGSINRTAMAAGLKQAYAVASNDTGHKGGSASFAMGHPEKLIDFGHRAMHEMVLASESIIKTFYGRAHTLSYFEGCSTGGRQGLMAAQRYPEDFDAIIAGAPVNNMFSLTAAQMHALTSILKDRSLYLPEDKIQLLSSAVLQACEVNDGIDDGFLNNPEACRFDPRSLQCEGTGTEACLTPGEVESVRRAYAPTLTSDGQFVYPGHAPGFEQAWRMPAQGETPSTLQSDTFTYLVHEDPLWDWRDFDLDRDFPAALDRAAAVHATDPDLSAFKANGGKLLLYHGWNDPGPSPLNTISYYRQVLNTMGADQGDWLRLFMMPGMGHCRGGNGPDQAPFLSTVAAWREAAHVPERITAARIRDGRVDMTRPLCPYPQVAVWNGEGSPHDAASFECGQPAR